MKGKKKRQRQTALDDGRIRAAAAAEEALANQLRLSAPVNLSLLPPNNSYGVPEFVRRGYYLDLPFVCEGCASEEVWTALQQNWWCEVSKGFAYPKAKHCRACRRKNREASAE